jgi:hypothetical protein
MAVKAIKAIKTIKALTHFLISRPGVRHPS